MKNALGYLLSVASKLTSPKFTGINYMSRI